METVNVDPSDIMAFVKSVQNVFSTMLQVPLQIGTPTIKTDTQPPFDVTGIIGMSGDVEGSVVLSFPTATAERVVSIFSSTEITKAHPDFPDAIGELVNMISGGAKAQFKNKKVTITCPSVIIGADHVVHGRRDSKCIMIPCGSDLGDFVVEVWVRMVAANTAINAA